MRKLYYILLISSLTAFFSSANAGNNPIQWNLLGSLPTQSQPNQSYAFSYRFTSNLPFTMPTPLYVATTPSTNEFTVVNACNGKKLAPKASCTVDIVFVPKTGGQQTFNVAMEYGKNKVILPTLTTNVASTSSPLQASVSLPFPTSILSNTTYYISFTFTNTSSTTITNLNIANSGNNTAGFSQVSNNCGSTLNAGASCTITGSFNTAATSGFVTAGLVYTSSGGSGTVNTATVVNNATGAQVRTFTLINNSNQAISFGFNGGAIPHSPSCSSDSNCPHGTHCRASTNLCYFSNPVPINGQYSLAANGGSNTVSITNYSDLPYVWSGGIAGRTGCPATGACATADCGSNGANNACPVGQGFSNPATLAEMTLQATATDNYDITAINGVNIGLSMGPTNNTPASTQPYFCGNPGNTTANNAQMGNCNWNLSSFVPTPASTSSTYIYVSDTTGHACTTTSGDCGAFAGTVCGISFGSGSLTKTCGRLLGFLNANQVCSFANTNFTYPNSGNNPGDPFFNCDSQISSSGSGGNPVPASLTPYSELSMYACATPNAAQSTLNSCYKSYGSTVNDCCGCVDWWTIPGVNVPQSATQSCGGNLNQFWTNTVEPTVSWLKKACPTMYTYQYDDASSKFTCNNLSSSVQNTVNYTVTFFTIS